MAEEKGDVLPDVPAHLRAAATTKEAWTATEKAEAAELYKLCLGYISRKKFPTCVPAVYFENCGWHDKVHEYSAKVINEVCKTLRAAGYDAHGTSKYMEYDDGEGSNTVLVSHVLIDNPLKE